MAEIVDQGEVWDFDLFGHFSYKLKRVTYYNNDLNEYCHITV